MNRSVFETILGGVVLIIAVAFFNYGYNILQDKKSDKLYVVSTYFNNAGGVEKGADVRISGVVVGKVTKVSLDNENFKARVDMKISDKVALPVDSIVEIASDGFIGGKYIRLKAGSDTTIVHKNGTVKNAKDVVSLEQMLGKLIFLTTE